jgi:hypothetical protein
MSPPELTETEADALVDELATALEAMVDRSCADMGPLWLDATAMARRYLGAHAVPEMGFRPSERYLRLGKSSRCKYRTLAAWRHGALWRNALTDEVLGDRACDAVAVVYFSPYPKNEPPYAWSRSAAGAPGVERFDGPADLKDEAKGGCWRLVAHLRAEQRQLGAEGDQRDWPAQVRARILRPACRDTLRDLLKLEDLPPWEDE